MAEADLLTKVKSGLGVTGSYQDATITIYIDEVKAFMKDAGVPDATINSDASVGVIIRGVADLWNLSSGDVRFSDYFMKRVIQLAIKPVVETNV